MNYKLIITIIIVFLFQSCSDYFKNLGNGYFYRDEGGDIKDILCEYSYGEVPATVYDFDYNRNFIIAKQKPKINPDPLYSKKYIYENGLDSFYYWLVIKDNYIILGPLNINEFNEARNKYKVPKELKLE